MFAPAIPTWESTLRIGPYIYLIWKFEYYKEKKYAQGPFLYPLSNFSMRQINELSAFERMSTISSKLAQCPHRVVTSIYS